MKRTVFSSERGFTFIELMVVSFMLTLVLASVYSLYLTHQKTANIEDQVVEVQQNLRIGLDSITKDLRNAGFLTSTVISSSATATVTTPADGDNNKKHPISFGNANTLTLNTASPYGIYAKIASQVSSTPLPFLTSQVTFTVTTQESAAYFLPGDKVRIINPANHEQCSNLTPNRLLAPNNTGSLFNVLSTNSPPFTIKLTRTAAFIASDDPLGVDPGLTIFKAGDMIVKSCGSSYPQTIAYSLVSDPTSSPLFNLVRTDCNGSVPIASKISSLVFDYLYDDGGHSGDPGNPANTHTSGNYSVIRAVRVAIQGQTTNAKMLGKSESTREATTVVKLKNRFIQ